MVILNEKDIVPPPPYFAVEQDSKSSYNVAHSRSSSTIHLPLSASSSGSDSRHHQSRKLRRTAPPLPSHVLLLIIYSTLPVPGEYRIDQATGVRRHESAEEMAVRTTRTLFWMAFYLRAVNRGFYLASMHLLRSTFLPHYMQCVRAPYSSDPFPHTSVSSPQHHQSSSTLAVSSTSGRSATSVVSSMQCESEVLDLYILHQLHEDVFADDTSLHTSRPERLRDLFDFMQPRARLMDLVRAYGVGAGLVALSEEELQVQELSNEDTRGDTMEEEAGAEAYVTQPHYQSMRKEKEKEKEEKRSTGLNLKSKLARSTSTLTLVSPSAPGPSSSSSACASTPSESAYQMKIQRYSSSPSVSSYPAYGRFASYPASSSSATMQKRKRKQKILYTALRVSFSPRRVGLIYTPLPVLSPAVGEGVVSLGENASAFASGILNPSTSGGGEANLTTTTPRTIVDIPRERDEPLERSASRLVAGLKAWLDAR